METLPLIKRTESHFYVQAAGGCGGLREKVFSLGRNEMLSCQETPFSLSPQEMPKRALPVPGEGTRALARSVPPPDPFHARRL